MASLLKEVTNIFITSTIIWPQVNNRTATCALSVAERSYPMSEVRGSYPMTSMRSYPMSKEQWLRKLRRA